MPKNIVSFQFPAGANVYKSDAGLEFSLNSRFVAPPDIDGIAAGVIVTAAGGIITNEPAVCSDSAAGKPRKLQFIRASGNSMSLAFADINSVLTVAATVKGILDNSAGANNQVVCIKLEGEEFLNLNDELGLTYDGTTFAPSHKAPPTADKQNFASGVITYNAHALSTVGGAVNHSIRSITEKTTNEFAAQLGTTPTTCIGDFLTLLNCGNGRRNPRKHRRYLLNFATKADIADTDEEAQTETIELPVASATEADILSCGQAAAGLDCAYCIGYKGEDYTRVHKLIA